MSEIVTLNEDVSQSPLYSEDLAPVPPEKRTWNMWNMAAIWVGMAVCIPTYLLASYMIKDGLGWLEALVIIFIANLLVTLPMALNGHAGVKYGVPFPVLGRSAFGILGVHVPSIVRGLIACGWFGIQTWLGGLAIHAIGCALVGQTPELGLTTGKFISFGLFWVMNIYFIWKGTESIRWLETFAAPILVLIGLILIGWGAARGGGFASVLAQSSQLEKATALIDDTGQITLSPLRNLEGQLKANAFRIASADTIANAEWQPLEEDQLSFMATTYLASPSETLSVQFRNGEQTSSVVTIAKKTPPAPKFGKWLFWLTAMVGFWATMSISISDITRYAHNQKEQVMGQFLGLPGTMLLYSFVGVFVTCAALIGFDDILISNDAPWDPVTLLGRFENPVVVVIAQFFMLIATLSTNIAANVIAPANAFANAVPRLLSFRLGGVVTGVIGIAIAPWWLLDRIQGLLLFVSGLLGPVLGVMVADYFLLRRTVLSPADLFKTDGCYSYAGGFNVAALVAMSVGVATALVGHFYPPLQWFYTLSWFSGCGVSIVIYLLMMRGKVEPVAR